MILWLWNRKNKEFSFDFGAGMIGAFIDCAVFVPIVLLVLFFIAD